MGQDADQDTAHGTWTDTGEPAVSGGSRQGEGRGWGAGHVEWGGLGAPQCLGLNCFSSAWLYDLQ